MDIDFCADLYNVGMATMYAIHSGGSRVRGLMVHMADTHGYGGIWLHELRRLEQHGY